MFRAAIVLLACLYPCAVRGQGLDPQPPSRGPEPPDRPFRGLFQPPQKASRNSQTLVLGAATYEAYDDDLASGLIGATDRRSQVSGVFSGFSSSLKYGKQTPRHSFGLSANTAAVYQSRASEQLLAAYGAAADVSTTFEKWKLSGHGRIEYSPFYQLAIALPAQVEEAADARSSGQSDYSLVNESAVSRGVNVDLSRQMSTRTSFGLNYALDEVNFVGGQPVDDVGYEYRLIDEKAGVAFAHGLGRDLSMHLGYAYRFGRRVASTHDRPIRGHDIDVGLGYDRALSLSRRTRLSFSTGSTIVANDAVLKQLPSGPLGSAYYFFVVGDANVTHEMGRTWGATAGFHRGVQYTAGFLEPLLLNTGSAALGGFVRPRVHLGIVGYYSIGAVGLASGGNGYNTQNGSARLTFAVARRLSIFGEYLAYRYRFDADAELPFGVARTLNRHGVRVGLSLSTPLLRSQENTTR